MPPKEESENLIPIDRFNLGGLAYSKWSGPKHSLYKMIGFDPHSLPGILQVEQKLTKDSGSTVTEFCREAVNCSNGIRYWFSYTSGKVWQEKAGAYTLVYTTSPAAGDAGCLGAQEYQGYIYWATQSRLHRIAVANADGAAAWTASAVPNWATFSITDASFHPMLNHPAQKILYIGDGNYLAQVDAGTFSANALDIATPLRIKSLGQFNTDILIGTYVADTITRTEIIRWNGWSVSYTTSDPIPEIGINAFLPADNMVLVQAGKAGNIYRYNGEELDLWGKIPGEYSSSAYGEVYPSSVANKEGQILMGFSNGSGNPADQLVYRIGRHSRDFLYIMDQPYPISQRSDGEFVLTSVEIGAILVAGSLIYVAWKNGSSYGVDELDTTAKLDGAYLESRVTLVNREEFSNFSKAIVAYALLPAGTDIDMYLSKNYADYGSALSKVDDDTRNILESKDEGTEFTTLQLKLKATVSDNDAPRMESAGIFLR